jgi:hypothetical protein
MTDRRALLTEREREIVAGEADVSDSYRYQTISRVRARFSQLEKDLVALEQHGDLAVELRGIVCGEVTPPQERRESGKRPAKGGEVVDTREDSDRREPTPAPADEAASDNAELDSALDALDTTEARREAVRGCIAYLREHGTGQKSEFVDAVYPEHPGGYGSEGGWWNKIGKEYLQAVAEDAPALTPPAGEGSHTWRWEP